MVNPKTSTIVVSPEEVCPLKGTRVILYKWYFYHVELRHFSWARSRLFFYNAYLNLSKLVHEHVRVGVCLPNHRRPMLRGYQGIIKSSIFENRVASTQRQLRTYCSCWSLIIFSKVDYLHSNDRDQGKAAISFRTITERGQMYKLLYNSEMLWFWSKL